MVFPVSNLRLAVVKAAFARPSSACRSFATSARPVNSAVLQQLEMFPEFKESSDACHKHQFDRAVVPLTRVLQVCDTISPALALEAAWELGKVHARLGHVEEAVRLFKRDLVHGNEQAVRVLLAHGDGAAALALAASLPSPSKEVYAGVAQYLVKGDVVLPEATDAITTTDVAAAVSKANYAALAAASGLSSHDHAASKPIDATPESHPQVDHAVTLWNELVETFSSLEVTTQADLSFLATVLTNLGEVHLAQGRTEEAMDVLGQALKRNEATPSQPLELARTLGLLAVGYHRLGQAVSSEGLFSSSLDKYEAAPHLSRAHVVAHAKTLVGYGHLLKQWEKREAVGDDKIAKGIAILQHDSWLPLVYLGLD